MGIYRGYVNLRKGCVSMILLVGFTGSFIKIAFLTGFVESQRVLKSRAGINQMARDGCGTKLGGAYLSCCDTLRGRGQVLEINRSRVPSFLWRRRGISAWSF